MIVYIVWLSDNLVFVTTQKSAVSKYLDSIINDVYKYGCISIEFWHGEKKILTKSPAEFYRYASNMKKSYLK